MDGFLVLIFRTIFNYGTIKHDYWFLNFGRDYHCGLIGYQVKKKPHTHLLDASHGGNKVPVALKQKPPATANANIASIRGTD